MSHLKLDSHSEVTLALGPIDGNPALGGCCLWKTLGEVSYTEV